MHYSSIIYIMYYVILYITYVYRCVYYELILISVKSSVVDIYNPGELVCNVFNFFSSSEDGDQ